MLLTHWIGLFCDRLNPVQTLAKNRRTPSRFTNFQIQSTQPFKLSTEPTIPRQKNPPGPQPKKWVKATRDWRLRPFPQGSEYLTIIYTLQNPNLHSFGPLGLFLQNQSPRLQLWPSFGAAGAATGAFLHGHSEDSFGVLQGLTLPYIIL